MPYGEKHALDHLQENSTEFITCIVFILETLLNSVFHRHSFLSIVKMLSELTQDSEERTQQKDVETANVLNGESSTCEAKSVDEEQRLKANKQELLECFQEFCASVVKSKCDLEKVLSALNQCHSYQIKNFCSVIAAKDAELLKQVQAALETSGRHNRLKSIFNEIDAT